jgi:glycosyltransferase involved in cell wall biosynthesis
MMAGLPVAATQVGDLPYVIGSQAGRLAPAGNPQALAQAICALLADPALRLRLGAAAQAQARGEYSAEIWMDRLAALYASLTQPTQVQEGGR